MHNEDPVSRWESMEAQRDSAVVRADDLAARVVELEQIERELRAELARVNERIVEYHYVNRLATDALERYCDKFGALDG